MTWDIPLRGPAGEPLDLRRTLASHGVASLPPMLLDEERYERLEVTIPLNGARPRIVAVTAGRKRDAWVEVQGRAPGLTAAESLLVTIRHVLNLDDNLSPFYVGPLLSPVTRASVMADFTWRSRFIRLPK